MPYSSAFELNDILSLQPVSMGIQCGDISLYGFRPMHVPFHWEHEEEKSSQRPNKGCLNIQNTQIWRVFFWTAAANNAWNILWIGLYYYGCVRMSLFGVKWVSSGYVGPLQLCSVFQAG